MLSYVATGEVTTLKHEVGDDTVEGGALVTEALLTGAEGAEVLGGLWDDVAEEVEVDAAIDRAVRGLDVEETRIHQILVGIDDDPRGDDAYTLLPILKWLMCV